MKVFIRGKGETDLSQNDFLAQGGEGSVYAKGSTAFKIYTDKKDMIPLGKIQELSVLTNPNIIRPLDILCDKNNNVIGYTMTYVKDTYALCQLFTKAFRQRNNISPVMAFDLVKKLQDIVKYVHDHHILIVDLNEMNILINKKFTDTYLIDVDSVQTPSFHATALMESIRDRHSQPNQFNTGTDWFAFAIVSFNTMIGIHPYKGKHPSIKDMDTRMLKNISVFDKDVSLPGVCYDFSVIPKNYLNWYKALFDDGKRLPPPFDGDIIQVIQKINTIVGNDKFDIKELFDFGEEIDHLSFYNGIEVCVTLNNVFINRKKTHNLKGIFGITPKKNKIVSIFNNELYDLVSGEKYNFTGHTYNTMSYQGRLYNKEDMNICEIQYIEDLQKPIAQNKIVGKVMPNAKLFNGGLVQDLMGTYYISLFPKTGTCYQIKLNDFKGAKIVEGKFENNVLMLNTVNKNGSYDKFIYRFNDDYTEFDLRHIKNIESLGFNFTVLDNGICVHIITDEHLEVFSNKKDSTGLKVINDPIITSDMLLSNNGSQVIFTKGAKVFSLKMK